MFYVQRDAQGQLIRVEAAAYAEARAFEIEGYSERAESIQG